LCHEFDLDVGRREEVEGGLKWDLRWDGVGIFEWLRGERLHTVLAMEEVAVSCVYESHNTSWLSFIVDRVRGIWYRGYVLSSSGCYSSKLRGVCGKDVIGSALIREGRKCWFYSFTAISSEVEEYGQPIPMFIVNYASLLKPLSIHNSSTNALQNE